MLIQKASSMRSLIRFLVAIFAFLAFSSATFAQTHFTFTSTSTSASVAIPAGTASIAGIPLTIGDEIGVFTPGGVCAGAGVCDASGATGFSAFQSETNPLPPPTNLPGFNNGDAMSFRVWSKSRNKEFSNVSVSYSVGNGIYGPGRFYVLSSLNVLPGPAAKYILSTSNASPIAGTGVTITAQLADADDLPVSTAGKVVTWSKTGSGGSFGTPTSTTNSSGIATVTFTTGTVAGTVYAVTGTDNTALTGTSPNITTMTLCSHWCRADEPIPSTST